MAGRLFLAGERGEEGEWDEWRRRGNVGPLFFRTPSSLPFVPSSLFSPFSRKKNLELFRLQYLYRGLKPTLLQKIHPFQPASTTDFLEIAKLHAEASNSLVNRNILSKSLLTVAPDVSHLPAVSSSKMANELSGLNYQSPTND